MCETSVQKARRLYQPPAEIVIGSLLPQMISTGRATLPLTATSTDRENNVGPDSGPR